MNDGRCAYSAARAANAKARPIIKGTGQECSRSDQIILHFVRTDRQSESAQVETSVNDFGESVRRSSTPIVLPSPPKRTPWARVP